MNNITMTLQVDHLIMEALREDISSEDVTTNAVMRNLLTIWLPELSEWTWYFW